MAETKKIKRKPKGSTKQEKVKKKIREEAPILEDGFRYDYDDSTDLQN
ncbi:hypothetical protein [Bacillus sp. FJAT-27225]|nr:hypothetical protein [Bacillus sp. FJAT-27225]